MDCLQIEIFVAGPGIDAAPELEHVGGEQNWTVACNCGVGDDDGERMLQCDMCQTWMHAYCCGVPPSEEDPASFVCTSCAAKSSLVGAHQSVDAQEQDVDTMRHAAAGTACRARSDDPAA